MIQLECPNEVVTRESYGGKANWLNWLISHGYNVPRTFFIKASGDRSDVIIDRSLLSDDKRYAVRSSSIMEDDYELSNAGMFSTVLDVPLKDIDLAVSNVRNDAFSKVPSGIGIIIQEMVDAESSGVVFSSNPVNCSKKEVVISCTRGLGDRLVSGNLNSEDIIVSIDGNNSVHEKSRILSEEIVKQLCKISKSIEQELNLPVDMEWAVDDSNTLFILQCRPITNIFVKSEGVTRINKKGIKNIDPRFLNSDKINLRILSESKDTLMSKGYLVVQNCNHEESINIKRHIKRSGLCYGYSAVILYPKNISNKIVRAFIGDGNNFEKYVSCYRFTIHGYPDYDNLQDSINNLYKIAKEESWVCSIIIQEIFRPIYTGMIKKNDTDYIIEVAKGHYMSKGIIPMSTYIVDAEKNVIKKNEVVQNNYYEIVEGCSIEFTGGNDLVSLSPEMINGIVSQFSNYIDDNNVIIEFGITKFKDDFVYYLIDCMTANLVSPIGSNKICSGILSEGQIKGKLVKLELPDRDKALNKHFYDKPTVVNSDENIIYYAELPSIEYMHLIRPGVGFIFKEGSILCHLSILLREKQIPALLGFNLIDAKEGEIYSIDTSSDVVLKSIS